MPVPLLAEGKIAYTKAIALAKLKDEEKRINLLAEVIEHNLSLKEIKERIKQLQTKSELDSPKQRIDKLVKDINKVKLWEKEPKKWRKIEGWLSKIENILDDETIIVSTTNNVIGRRWASFSEAFKTSVNGGTTKGLLLTCLEG